MKKLSNKSKQFIQENKNDLSVEEMAKTINCSVNTINNILETSDKAAFNIKSKNKLRQKLQWKQLKEKFSDHELEKFEQDYGKLMEQFGEDVLPSEEMQIMQIIELGILLDRIMIEKQTTREHVNKLEKMQKQFYEKYKGDYTAMDENDRRFMVDLETQIGTLRSSEQNRTNEYTRLQEKHAHLMKDLKGTRDQRIKQIESGGKLSFIGLLKLLSNKDFQEQETRQLELFKLAAKKQKKELTDYHAFLDNEIDKPILLSDET